MHYEICLEKNIRYAEAVKNTYQKSQDPKVVPGYTYNSTLYGVTGKPSSFRHAFKEDLKGNLCLRVIKKLRSIDTYMELS